MDANPRSINNLPEAKHLCPTAQTLPCGLQVPVVDALIFYWYFTPKYINLYNTHTKNGNKQDLCGEALASLQHDIPAISLYKHPEIPV